MTDDMFSKDGPGAGHDGARCSTRDGTTLASLRVVRRQPAVLRQHHGQLRAGADVRRAVPARASRTRRASCCPTTTWTPTAATRGRAGTSTGRPRTRWRRSPGTAATPIPWTRPPGWRATPGINWGVGRGAARPPQVHRLHRQRPVRQPRAPGRRSSTPPHSSTPGDCEYDGPAVPLHRGQPEARAPTTRAATGSAAWTAAVPAAHDRIRTCPEAACSARTTSSPRGRFLHSDVTDPTRGRREQRLPPPALRRHDRTRGNGERRQADGLPARRSSRGLRLSDPKLVLANAVSLWLGGGTTALPWEGATVDVAAPNPPDPIASWRPPSPSWRSPGGHVHGVRRLDAARHRPRGRVQRRVPGVRVRRRRRRRRRHAGPRRRLHRAVGHPVERPRLAHGAATMGWIAVSGFDDTPHRPVNVPTAPYPQYDLDVALQGRSAAGDHSPPATSSPRPGPGSGRRTRRSRRSPTRDPACSAHPTRGRSGRTGPADAAAGHRRHPRQQDHPVRPRRRVQGRRGRRHGELVHRRGRRGRREVHRDLPRPA